MKQILFVTDALLAGGMEHHVTQLATHIDRTRFDPRVVCLYGVRAGRSLHFGPSIEAAGIPLQVLDLGWTPWDKWHGFLAIVRATRRFHPRIVHAFNYHSNLLARLARPFMPPGTRLVGDVGAAYTAKQIFYERISSRMCAAITCNSPATVDDLTRRAHIPMQKIAHILNGVDLERFSHGGDPATTRVLRKGATRLLVMLGRISREKSPQFLAQAVGILKEREQLPPGTRVLIIGERQDDYIQELIDQSIDHYGLSGIIEQHGSTEEPESYYAACDVTVLTSLWEGLPYVVVESLAAGRPMIISQGANIAGVIEDGVTGWVVRTGDVEHLASTIRMVLSLPQESLKGFRAACQRRAQDFSLDRMITHYQNLYERLTEKPNP